MDGPLAHLELQAYFTEMSGTLFYERTSHLYYKKLTFLAWVVGVSNLLDSEFFTYISNIKFSRFLLCVSTYFATIQFAKKAFPFVLSNNQDM